MYLPWNIWLLAGFFLLIYENTQSIYVSPSYLGYLTIDYLCKDALNVCFLHVIMASQLFK